MKQVGIERGCSFLIKVLVSVANGDGRKLLPAHFGTEWIARRVFLQK